MNATTTQPPQVDLLVRRHLMFGWWSLLIFLSLGTALEVMHGLKLGVYLSVANETRRLMWTLAHAHGALLGLVHIGFASSVRMLSGEESQAAAQASSQWILASRCFVAASVLMPGGFFLGGVEFYGGDPGLGIVLLPFGAASLFVAVLVTARRSGES